MGVFVAFQLHTLVTPSSLRCISRPAPAKKLPDLLQLSQAELTDDQLRILRTLTDDPMQVDDLIEATQLPARRVLSALTMLEIDEIVTQESGKRFSLAVTLQ